MAGESTFSRLVDDFTRECLTPLVDTSLTGLRVARELDRVAALTPLSGISCQRQRHRAHLKCYSGLAAAARCGMALHRTRQTDAEWLCRKLQRRPAR